MLAELNVRHTRRHMPTRRVALGDSYLPTSGASYGAVLISAVVVEHLSGLDEDQRELLPRFVRDAQSGLSIPRISLRYRLQTDVHGLDRSRHRILGEDGRIVIELDRHGRSAPQLIGAVMAAAALPSSARTTTFRAIEDALHRPVVPAGIEVRRLSEGVPGLAPFAPGAVPGIGRADPWLGIPSERRWAMEVLGLSFDMVLQRFDVQARFRRLARLAHPDHGAAREGAAERLAEIAEARTLLLVHLDSTRGEQTG